VKVAAIVGPTAVGKTKVSLEVAGLLGAEIVSLDSMQIYRGIDIGTDKISSQARAQVTHHLIDIKDPGEPVTVAEFQSLARAHIADIHNRGKMPLLVGGSGLYFRAVVDPLEFPPRSEEVRAELEEEAERIGAPALHQRLAELDPLAASRIEPGNARRTIRALEVIALTGERFSDNDSWETYESLYELRVVGLNRERADLYRRIEERVDAMLAQGLADEAKRLEQHLGPTARQALGYKQILDAPDATPDVWRQEIVRATKRFARRQISWFKMDPRVRWVEASHEDLAAAIVKELTT
jgi:tRNA dimethylallyltransferase